MLKSNNAKCLRLITGLLCVLFLFIIQSRHWPFLNFFLDEIDRSIYDAITRLSMRQVEHLPRVIVIDVDDYSVNQEGRWPWPRDKLALLLDNLKKLGVVVVAFDAVFSEPEVNYALMLKDKLIRLNNGGKEVYDKNIMLFLEQLTPLIDNDRAFADALRKNEVVLGYLFNNDPSINKGSLPPPLINEKGMLIDPSNLALRFFQGYYGSIESLSKAAGHGGFVTNIPDEDGVIRHALLIAGYKNKVYPSLTLATVMLYLLDNHVCAKQSA